MFARTAPAFAAGIVFAALAGGGVAYAAASQHTAKAAPQYASYRSATKSYDRTGVALDLDDNGYTDAIAAYARCPSGTQMTGGGISDYTSTGWLLTNAPDTEHPESWLVAVSVREDTTENPKKVFASVTCWSPKGNPPGGYRAAVKPTVSAIPADTLRHLKANASKR